MLKSIQDFYSNIKKDASWTRPRHRILMVGPSSGGKTTLLYKLKLGEVVTTIGTVGFNVEDISVHGTEEFTIWDVGGTWGNRLLWHHFAEGAVGIICVVDSTDKDQLEDAKTCLWAMFEQYDTQLKKSVLLVYANKQDLMGALSVAEVRDRLELEGRSEGRRWHIQGSIATSGVGLMDGLVWLATQLNGAPRAWWRA